MSTEGGEATVTAVFLDRDGVLNRKVDGDYVRTWEQFAFLPGVLDALAELGRGVEHVVVVTNQQGVGKGLMSAEDLADIHRRMCREIAEAGGRIDEVLSCPHLVEDRCPCRKPQPGLVAAWLARHPDVRASECVMVGDSRTDLELAASWPGGPARAVLVGDPGGELAALADQVVEDLGQFVAARRTRASKASG